MSAMVVVKNPHLDPAGGSACGRLLTDVNCFTRNTTRIDYSATHFAYSYEEMGKSSPAESGSVAMAAEDRWSNIGS